MLAGIGLTALLASFQASAGIVVTDHLISLSGRGQSHVPATFGQVFKNGDVPRGTALAARFDGRLVPLQVDIKATNPDGSLRHAVLTAMLPSLPGDAKGALTLATGPGSAATGASPTLAQLLDTTYDARISVSIDGKSYTASARSLLQSASAKHTCKAWGTECNVWLDGPLVGAWVVHGPVTAADGTSNPSLNIYFAVRAYAGAAPGRIGDVRTDIIVENTSAFLPQTQPQYKAEMTSGSATYLSPALTQYAYTRWHHVLWWNGHRPELYVQQDTRYIQASKAVSRYMALKPDEVFLNRVRQFCAPLDHCDQTKNMNNTGAQAGIGPLPRWSSLYIVDPDIRAYRWMLANTDALGAYSIHYRDPQTGWPVSIRRHPHVTLKDWAYANRVAERNTTTGTQYKADLIQGCTNNAVVKGCTKSWYGTGNPFHWSAEHQPAESYVPYMVTGDYYYMSELAFGASMNELNPNEKYRGFSHLLIDDAYHSIRAKAWTLRDMAEAAWLLPDNYPLKAEFTAAVTDSLAEWNKEYSDNPSANPLHVPDDSNVYSLHGGKRNGVAPWQHNFLTWSAAHAADLGFSGAARFRNWLAAFEIGLMTDWQSKPRQGYCWLQASAYDIETKDAASQWLPSFTAVYKATFPTLVGLACNSSAMVEAMGKLRKRPWQKGKMSGYPYSATGFPANFQIGVASAAESGLPNAQVAWNLFESRSVKPSGRMAYNNYPNFAVIPRSLPANALLFPMSPKAAAGKAR
ncbi:hypothetical protein [Dyella sp. A6]|uniref:hypothetical protein n=1 Tax=Dyella aluminiiresistens TaxID=3069105 RepID=UPI002E79153D|nr:hypothetical protein [Dyella sp. A6]